MCFSKKSYFYFQMPSSELVLFELLKKDIADTFRKTYPSCNIPMEEWKGQDIENFQEELIKTVKGRISEKWFYTHIKTRAEKLPRIDMLNILSQYAGYHNWTDFTSKKGDFTKELQGSNENIHPQTSINAPEKAEISSSERKNTLRWVLAGGGIFILLILFIFKEKPKTYRCCFVNLNGQALVPNSKIEVHLLNENESPVPIEYHNNGCFELETTKKYIRFIVRSPYYKTDTITRSLNTPLTEEHIKLQTNDYALMIHYFSTSKIKDWKQRKIQLEDMIAENAKIFQVSPDGSGMELYNKNEFINKLTMPLKSLNNIEIIETRYLKNQISLLRFIQTEQSK